MRKFYFGLLAFALAATSCQKELGEGGGGNPGKYPEIPADFNWKTTQDVQITVAAPVVDASTPPQYAVIRVYSSPILVDENLVAKGVATSATPFRTVLTAPAGADNIYVETTLPDGSVAVSSAAAAASVNVPGAAMKASATASPEIRIAAAASQPDMPDYPKMTVKTASDFASGAIVRSIKDGEQFGASWSAYPYAESYVPADADITVNAIDLNGFAPHADAVLYVAGKVNVKTVSCGTARLAVLPGGEVTVEEFSAQNTGSADKPAVYVFEGGKITVKKINFSGKSIVNCGQMVVTDDFDLNNSAVLYNTTNAVFETVDLDCSNNTAVYNDGQFTVTDELELNSSARFENRLNGDMFVHDFDLENGGCELYQQGKATFDELDNNNGKVYVNCYTYAKKLEGDNGYYAISAGACLESIETEFENTKVDMAAASMFVTELFNDDDDDDENENVQFFGPTATDGHAVIRFEKKAITGKVKFHNALEVVYDATGLAKRYRLNRNSFKSGAYSVPEQTVNVPTTECNGGKGQITPDPEPEPEEFETVSGAVYTYCFEDRWPWLGDYDMNDAIVVCSIDRNVSKDGSKVASLDINWELVAAGKKCKYLAFAVRMDKVDASEIGSAVSTHQAFGNGPFAGVGVQQDCQQAVIPFFNNTDEVLSGSNTWKGHAVAATTKHVTTVTFNEPVDIAKVVESEMNFFVAVDSRANEIHMPGYNPTESGIIGDGHILASDPYKYFVSKGEKMYNNYMMWALMIPGQFRYPTEGKDIRDTYQYFNMWASSNGQVHPEWYDEEADENLLY